MTYELTTQTKPDVPKIDITAYIQTFPKKAYIDIYAGEIVHVHGPGVLMRQNFSKVDPHDEALSQYGRELALEEMLVNDEMRKSDKFDPDF